MYDAICLGFKQYIWEAFLSLFFLTLLCNLSIVKYCLSYLHNAFQTHLLLPPSNPVVHNQVWFHPQGHLVMTGDLPGCHNAGYGTAVL